LIFFQTSDKKNVADDVIPEEKEEGKDTKDYKEMLQNGKYYLIPSFFSLMRALKKAKRDYAIVFRTFGSDLSRVVSEFNAYFYYS
jgi:hypothetical protein